MTTFVLKNYKPNILKPDESIVTPVKEEEPSIVITGSISANIANALNKSLANNGKLEELEADNQEENNKDSDEVSDTNKTNATGVHNETGSGNTTKSSEVTQNDIDVKNNSIRVVGVTTEDINRDPLNTLRSIKPGSVVYIRSRGFSTAKESWFIDNVSTRATKLHYTLEGLVSYITNQLGVKDES